jgi:uncharacterized pyridoxamine 5'-phosphate oxidase family protein
MTKSEILAFITATRVCYLATAEGNKPHVRTFGTFRADENGIIYFTQKSKDVYKQLVKNPEIEVCYYANDIQIRLHGRLQPVADMALKKEIVEKRPFLKPQVEKEGWDYLAVFNLKKCQATVLDMKAPTPKTWIDL